MRLLKYLAAVLLTLLPPRYRKGTSLRGAAIVCGVGQAALMLFQLVERVIRFSQEANVLQQSGLSPEIIYEASHGIGEPAVYGSGIFLSAAFLLRPLNILIIYLAFEGLIRALAALVGHQVIGSLPFYAISGIHGLWDRKKYKQYIGPLVDDEVIRGGEKQEYALKIYSCRPKVNWSPYIAIEFEDQLYQSFKEEQGGAPRRFIYYLRKYPTGVAAPIVDHYTPSKPMNV